MSDPTGRALLQDITDNPDDDTPRLVYADWLEERGESDRAELIRLQVRRSRLPEGDSEAAKLRRRERVLLGQHGAAWSDPGVASVSVQMSRGFVEHVDCDAETLVTHGPALFERFPIRRLTMRADEFALKRVQHLATQPWLARLTDLRVQRVPGTAAGLGDQGFEALIASPHLTRLRVLELYSCGLTARSARALAAASHLKLAELQWSWNPLFAPGARELAGAAHLAGLTRLDLSNSTLTPDGAVALAGSPHLRNLRVLDLTRANIQASGVRELTASSLLAAVEVLTLNRGKFAVRAAQALARCAHLGNLRELYLNNNRLADDGAAALAQSPHLTNLQKLGLRANRMTFAGAAALAEAQHWPKLRSIELTRNDLGAQDRERLRSLFVGVSVKF